MKQSTIKYFLSILIIVFLFGKISFSQNSNIHFYNLNEEYGISIREANQVLSDDYGFIWIATKMGVVRYTPDDIKTYNLPFDSQDVLTVQLVYKNGKLYAYTNNGQILKYNTIQDKFEMVLNISKDLNNPYIMVNNILVDDKGKFWIASSFGIFSYDDASGLKAIDNKRDVEYMEWFQDRQFFFACTDGIHVYSIPDSTFSDYYFFPTDLNLNISRLHYDRESDRLWVGTNSNGLFRINREQGALKLIKLEQIPNQPIMDIEANADNLLLGIDGQGLWIVNKNTDKVENVYMEDADDHYSLKGNGVYDIYLDAGNRVWVCTYSGGASYFDQANSIITEITHKINSPNSLVNDDVNGVLEDSDGNLWFATNNGLSCWNVKTGQWKSFYHNNTGYAQVFQDVCEDNEGRIWAGTYSSGVYVLERSTGRELKHYLKNENNPDYNLPFVLDLCKDSQGNIWIGGVLGDLVCYSESKKSILSFGENTVKVLEGYTPGKILIGSTVGLVLFDTETRNSERLVEGYIVYDLLLQDSTVWLCTGGNGVIKYNLYTREITGFTVDDGLPSNFVNSITFSEGYIWLGTEKGLCRMNRDGSSVVTFNVFTELSDVSFNPQSDYELSNGKLLWGTNKGGLIFDPKELDANKFKGNIFFQDLTIAGRSIRELQKPELNKPLDSLKELSLKYYQNTISLEMLPISVSSPGSKFSWKMDGLDNEWSKPSVNRILSYSNMPSGTYTLNIKMMDNSLTQVIQEREIVLHLVPPYWQEMWFRVLFIIFISGLVAFGLIYYIDRLKKQHSDDKIRFFSNTAHDIRTSLTLINGPIEELNKDEGLCENSLYYLHLATEQTHRLSGVVNQLMDFQKVDIGKEKLSLAMKDIVKTTRDRIILFESYAISKDIKLQFTTNLPVFFTAFDEIMIEKIIDNLVSNAIKYSLRGNHVLVSLECSGTRWVLQVQDHGIGIDRKAQKQLFKEYYRGENAVNSKVVGSGIGLLLVKNYVDLHDGKINCHSALGEGSTFQVTIPYKELNNTLGDQQSQRTNTEPSVFEFNEVPLFNALEGDEINLKNPMKILIVEDNSQLQKFLHTALNSQFLVSTATDGQEAWELIQKNAPDLVVSDIMMPNMDGFELCSKIKSTFETSHVPVILLTSLTGKAQELKGLGLGADDYLTKPFDVTLLKQRIKTIIKNRETIHNKALKLINPDNSGVVIENEFNDQFLKKIVEVVRKNIGNAEFSRDDFAAELNMSQSLLYKKMKALTNQSPTDFIKSIRLDHALALLRSKKYTITEVSELCGFSSVGYFGMVFRKHYGKSPSQAFE